MSLIGFLHLSQAAIAFAGLLYIWLVLRPANKRLLKELEATMKDPT